MLRRASLVLCSIIHSLTINKMNSPGVPPNVRDGSKGKKKSKSPGKAAKSKSPNPKGAPSPPRDIADPTPYA